MGEYRALYRKWRPRTFDDVCGQETVTDILKYEVENKKISHAYLFCGSRGTGKTSSAKILSKAVNCLSPINGNPCNQCAACRAVDNGTTTDVIEMDAASNNGVDNVRDLKEEIAFLPSELKYRVYIIDEVHMMSGSAFNALLKTLEEPPQYVVFILATTEFAKLPSTIVSRCQRFDFCRIPTPVIMERLSKIAGEEGIDLTEDGCRLIARAAQGGMRDAISLLELCAGSRQKITAALAAETIGAGNRSSAYQMIGAIVAADYARVYDTVRRIVMSSADLTVFWQDLLDAYRDLCIVMSSKDAAAYLDLTEDEYATLKKLASSFTMGKIYYHTSILTTALADMQKAINSKRSIAEIALTKMCDPKLSASADGLCARVEELEKELSKIRLTGVAPMKSEPQPPSQSPSPEGLVEQKEETASEPEGTKVSAPASSAPVPYAKWGQVLERIGELKKSLSAQFFGAGVMKIAEGRFCVTMNAFFAKRLAASEADMQLLRGAIAECEGTDVSRITVEIKEKTEQKHNIAEDLQTF